MNSPCEISYKISKIISNFTVANQNLANNLFQQLYIKIQSVMAQSFQFVKANKSNLFNDFQNVDPNGFAQFQSLAGSTQLYGNKCNASFQAIKNFYQTLNAAGQLDFEKISFNLMLNFKKNIAGPVGQFFFQNADTFVTLKNNEGRKFNQLIETLQNAFAKMKH
jgi:hypothetical protein